MSKYKYEVGGRVKISGKWYKIVISEENYLWFPVLGAMLIMAIDEINEGYLPPITKPKPFDWVPKHYDFRQARNGMTHHESVNAWLTEKYGDPTERVYNGEAASEFGLKPDSRILWFLENDNTWADISYRFLAKGDIWRKQPPLLTIKKGGEQ